jgi:hypothetical protein
MRRFIVVGMLAFLVLSLSVVPTLATPFPPGGGGPPSSPSPSPSPPAQPPDRPPESPPASPPGQPPDRPPAFTVTTPRGVVTIEGRRFGPGTRVTVERRAGGQQGDEEGQELSGPGTTPTGGEFVPVTETTTDESGNFVVEVPEEQLAPDGEEVAQVELRVTGQDRAGRSAVRQSTIADAHADAATAGLSASGLQITLGQVLLAVLAVIAGAGLLLVARRRSTVG